MRETWIPVITVPCGAVSMTVSFTKQPIVPERKCPDISEGMLATWGHLPGIALTSKGLEGAS